LLNIISYLTSLALAIFFSSKLYPLYWWSPTIIIPLILWLENNVFYTPSISLKYKTTLDNLMILVMVLYVGLQVYLFYVNIAWYGAIIGFIVGYIAAPFMAPERWRYSLK